MAKPKRLLQFLLVIGCLFVLAAQPLQVQALPAGPASVRSTSPGSLPPSGLRYQDIPDTYELVGEDSLFQLYANRESLAFKVLDKRSGYLWHSNLDEKAEGDRLNKTWTAFASSGISIDYLDVKAISERASITNAERTIDFRTIDQGFQATVKFLEPSISLDLIVRLENGGVSVEFPFASIKQESPDFRLGFLYVYPFMGATRNDTVPGYMFIPDGSGSLIRFGAETKAANMFYGRYYGADLGMIAELPWDPEIKRPLKISIPVTGMVHGEKQNAYLAIVEKGASYGEIQAHPSGIITNFNFLHNAFVYNESYFQATNRSGAGVTTLQKNTNAFDVKILYRFLTGDDSDYVGMARSYQQYLVEKGTLEKLVTPGGEIGIRLEFLGGDKEKVLVWNRLIPMTTLAQMVDILNRLEVKNPDVVYYGWQPSGASSMWPKNLKLDRKLGSLEELKTAIEAARARGGNFYLYLDPQAALYQEKGYSPRHDLAMSITNVNLIGYNRFMVNYYFNYKALSERYRQLSDPVLSKTGSGLALDTIGSMLYTDFKDRNFLNREEAIQKYQELFSQTDGHTAFYLPNDYLYAYMNAYYDIPLTNNGYIYTTDAVPFIQIVLAGYVPYYGPALNFSPNLQDDLLRQIDFGVYPSFFVTQEATAKILNTRSNWIYTSSYDQWGKDIEETYAWVNNLLGPVKGETIVARQMLAEGVAAVTYSNGMQIIVNYTDKPFGAGSLVVDAKDAVIREALP